MSNREVTDLIRALERQGWRIKYGRHVRAYPPDRNQPPATFPRSPSDSRRGMANTRADLRRRGAVL